MADKAQTGVLTAFIERILAFFSHPAVFVVTLIAAGFLLILAAAHWEATYPTLGKALNLSGVTILGAGAFTGITKAFFYGGIFRATALDALMSQEFKTHLENTIRAASAKQPSIQSHGRQFDHAVASMLPASTAIDSLDIFAHSSSKYLAAFRNHEIKVRKARLLLVKADSTSASLPTPVAATEREAVRHEMEITAGKWIAAKNEGLIDELEIRTYSFGTCVHFMLVNRSAAQFGFFRLVDTGPGVSTLSNFVVEQDGAAGKQMIADLQSFFDDVFAKRSTPWSSPITATPPAPARSAVPGKQ